MLLLLLFAIISLLANLLGHVYCFSLDSKECPFGWMHVLDHCIKLHPERRTPENAQLACVRDSSTLLKGMKDGDFNEPLLKELIRILEELFDDGFLETKWLIAPLELDSLRGISERIWKRKHTTGQQHAYVMLSRTVNVTYTLDVAAPFLEYSFICSLEGSMKQKLLYQTSFMPKGAPELILQPENEYYCRSGVLDMYINLPCKAVGNPSPDIEWFKNGVEKINATNGSGKLIINGGVLMIPCGSEGSKSRSTIYASYHCTATNKYGSIRSPTTVVRPTFIEQFDTQRLDVYPFGYTDGTRIECQAPVHYPKSYSYSWMTGGSTDAFVVPDERVFISHDGTLFFSYNLKKDATSYACLLSLTTIYGGHYGPFFNLRLSEKLNEALFAPRIDESQPQIFPEHPRVGDTVYIDCFAYGRPAPKYYWSRADGIKLSSRATLSDFDRVLTITSVSIDDAGSYRCTADNEFGTDSAEVLLNVNSRPKVIWALKDRMLPTNATAHFECLSNSKEANVEWFKNSMPISPLLMSSEDRVRYSVRDLTLSVFNTRESDSGMYQCFISNEAGTVVSSARLTVKDIGPQFATRLMPKKLFAVAGSDLTVPCIFFSLPLGNVDWYDKFGKKVGSNGRRRHLEDVENRLQIDEIMLHDEGVYVCRASNRVGISNYEVRIHVLRKPTLSVNPLSQRITPDDNNVKLSCEIETLCDSSSDCPDSSFTWSANGASLTSLKQYQKVAPSIVQEIHTANADQFTKMRVKSEIKLSPELGIYRLGQFACVSSFGGGSSDIMPKYSFIPPLLSVNNVSSTTLTLSWKNRSVSHILPISNALMSKIYSLDMRTNKNNYWSPVSMFSNQAGNNLMVFKHLNAAEKYQFRIRPKESFGVMDSTSETEWVTTAPKLTKIADLHLQYIKLDPSHFLVSWVPFRSEDGLHIEYQILWSTSTEGGSSVTTERSYVIPLKKKYFSCCELIITVKALNSIDTTLAKNTLLVPISSEAPTRVAVKLIVDQITSSTAYLIWQWNGGTLCENVNHVQVFCQSSLIESETHEQFVSSNSTSAFLSNLKPETEYRCTVRAYDDKKQPGNSSEIIEFVTKIRPPMMKPKLASWSMQKRMNVYLTTLCWYAIMLQNNSQLGASINRGYNIRIFVTETASKPIILRVPETTLKDRQHPSVAIEGLKFLYRYKIQISGYNEGGEGPLSDLFSMRIDALMTEGHSFSNGHKLRYNFIFWLYSFSVFLTFIYQ